MFGYSRCLKITFLFMSLQDFDLIIFDLDGTLLDTVLEISQSVNAGLQALALPLVEPHQIRDWVGQGAEHLFTIASQFAIMQTADKTPLTTAQFQTGFAAFMAAYELYSGKNSQLYPYVRQALDQLQQDGKHLAVVTNKVKHLADLALAQHNLLHYFELVIGGDTFAQKKPDPYAIHYCRQHYQVAEAKTLFVGDSVTDVLTARNANVAVWALPYGYNHGEPIEKSRPDQVVADFSVFLK